MKTECIYIILEHLFEGIIRNKGVIMQVRQTKVDYALIHEYLSYINFKHKYERIYLVEPVSSSQFVIRLKFPHTLETLPVYVNNRQWEYFLANREKSVQE